MDRIEHEKWLEKQRIQALIEDSRIPINRFGYKFDDFEAKTNVQKRALQAAKDFCWYPKTDEDIDQGPDHKWALTFHGTPGTGKTMLTYIIARVFIVEVGLKVLFWNVPELLNRLRRGYTENDYYELLSDVKNADFLILDDLGMEKMTDWASEQIDLIIDYRYRNQEDLVVTTNISFKDLQPRIRSRLSEGITVSMTGEDYRMLIGLGKVIKKNAQSEAVNEK